MIIRRLFGLDLAGKLASWKSEYKGNVRLFDHRTVWCRIEEYANGTWEVCASAYCNDARATGLSFQPIAHIYRSHLMDSMELAESHMSLELARASRKFPETQFVRTFGNEEYVWKNCQWKAALAETTLSRCVSCGHSPQELVCPQCGELMY